MSPAKVEAPLYVQPTWAPHPRPSAFWVPAELPLRFLGWRKEGVQWSAKRRLLPFASPPGSPERAPPERANFGICRTPGRHLSSRASFCAPSESAAPAAVLLRQPLLERREVLEHRSGVHLPLPGHRLERVLPRLRGPEREHLPQPLSRDDVVVDCAGVQGALEAHRFAERAVELELQDAGEEVARVGNVGGHVVLRAGIEVGFAALDGGRDALVATAQFPPGGVVAVLWHLPGEDVPPPAIDEQPEGQE